MNEFRCERCLQPHEEKETIVVKEDGGVVVYGVACVREMVREIDALTKDQAAAELALGECDSVRGTFLARRAEGLKSMARVRRRTEDINLTLVKGGRG